MPAASRRGEAGSLLLSLLLFAVLLFADGCGDSGTKPGQDAATFGEKLRSVRRSYGIPAMAAAIIRDTSITVEVDGVRKAGTDSTVLPADCFHLGSNTKAMTATLVAMLVEQGRVAWATRPIDVIPELAAVVHADYREITLEQLLSHRAGVPALDDIDDLALIPPFSGSSMEQRKAFVLWLLAQPPEVPRGTFLYSNAGYGVAAAMIEQVMNESWEILMSAELFDGLGVSGVFGWPAAHDPYQPWGHLYIGGFFVPHDPSNPAEWVPTVLAPAGDVSMAIGDYASFVRMHLRGLRGENTLVTAATMNKLHTPNGEYALGWEILPIGGVPSSAHVGSGGTFYAFAVIQPSRNLALAILANSADEVTDRAFAELAAWILRYSQ
ncbi:MAG: serine hydrolase domain-containing protein [Candidatus Eisenbacteria bacterium]